MGAGTHAMYQIVGERDTIEGSSQTVGFKSVAGDYLDLAMPRATLKSRRVPHNASDALTGLQQLRHETAADVPRCTCYENQSEASISRLSLPLNIQIERLDILRPLSPQLF